MELQVKLSSFLCNKNINWNDKQRQFKAIKFWETFLLLVYSQNRKALLEQAQSFHIIFNKSA